MFNLFKWYWDWKRRMLHLDIIEERVRTFELYHGSILKEFEKLQSLIKAKNNDINVSLSHISNILKNPRFINDLKEDNKVAIKSIKDLVESLKPKEIKDNSSEIIKELESIIELMKKYHKTQFDLVNDRTAELIAREETDRDTIRYTKELMKAIQITLNKLTKPKPIVIPKEEPVFEELNFKSITTKEINAILASKIKGILNASNTILSVPTTAKVLAIPVKEGVRGLKNNRCYDNALIYSRANLSALWIGVIIHKSVFRRIIDEETPERVFTFIPFLHAWNLENDKIIDTTIGSHDAKQFVYIGMELTDVRVAGYTPEVLENFLKQNFK